MNTPATENENRDTVMVPDDAVASARSLKQMLDGLVLNRTEAIVNEFYNHRYPFLQIYTSQWTNVVFAGLEWKGAAFRIDIVCRPDGYSFRFWDENDKQGRQGRARETVQLMNYFNADIWQGGVFRKEFEYPCEETDLYLYLTMFKRMLAEAIDV